MEKPSPSFISDRPITKAADDSLHRLGFSKRLVNAVRSVPGDESLVLALYGPWGSGKSSIKNLMLEELHSDHWTSPIILEFNPWRLGDESQLLASFFADVAKKLQEYSDSLSTEEGSKTTEAAKASAKVRVDIWKKYGRYVAFGGTATKAASTMMALVGVPGSPLLTLLGSALAASGELLDHAETSADEAGKTDTVTLEDLRNDLRKSFESDDLKKNVLVIVDDLDRLSQSEIVLMFRLIKANADFPRFIFLLLCEEDRVAKAHDEVAGGPGLGQRYLEKIVQIPLRVPAPNSEDIRQYFGQSLKRLISNLSSNAKEIWKDDRDQERFSILFEDFLRPYSQNLRSVNRYLNSLSLGMASFVEGRHFEANPIDVMALEAIKVFEPSAYERLAQSSRSTLLGNGIDLFSDEKTEAKALLANILEKAGHKDRVESVVLLLFPTMHEDLGRGGGYGGQAEQQWRADLRICTSACFDRYFSLDLRSSDLKESEFDDLVRSVGDEKLLAEILRQLSEQEKLGKLLFRLEGSHELAGFSTKEIILLFSVLWDFAPDVPEHGGATWGDDGRSQVFILLRGFLRGRPESEKRDVVLGIIGQVRKISSAAYMVARFESNLRSQELPGNIPSKETLEDAGKLVLQQIESAGGSGNLIDLLEEWPGIVTWWHGKEPEKATSFLRSALQSPKGMAAFLRSCSGRVSSDRRSFDYVDLKSVEEVIPAEELEEAISVMNQHELESYPGLSDLVDRFRFVLDRRRKGLSINGSDMEMESERS